MKRLVIFLAIFALLPSAALAQRGRGMRGGGNGRMSPPMDEHTALLIFTAILSLTDAQQQRIGAVFDAAVKTAGPLNTQIDSGRQAIFEAVKSGETADAVKALSDKQGALESQMLALQSQTFLKMFAMLTSDQKLMVDNSIFTNIGEFLSNAREPLPETALPAATAPAPL